MTAIIHVQGSG